MTTFRAACIQMRSSRSVTDNCRAVEDLVRQAASAGAHYVQTPEMTTLLERKRTALMEKVRSEADDPALRQLRALAAETGIWLHIGSIAVLLDDGRVANRGYLIAPDSTIAARYDKIHMFDVDLPGGERYRESGTYRPGDRAIIADLPWARLGMTICYDLRFPDLYRQLTRSGAGILTAPSSFTRQTGAAHWHLLLRARAVENGCFMIAAAQAGDHEDGRKTYGHSLIVDPWGDILAEAGEEPGIIVADIDPARIDAMRQRIPALANERSFDPPQAGGPASPLRSVS